MSADTLRDVVARLATEPALGDELDSNPAAFARQHQLSVDEVTMSGEPVDPVFESLLDEPPGAQVEEQPGGGRLIRYPDGATATVVPNPDGSVHVVERNASGEIVDEFNAAEPMDDPDDDGEPASLLDVGAGVLAAGAVSAGAAAEIVRRRRARTGRRGY